MGVAGAHVLLRDGRSQTIPGFKVAAVDTNGAGDTHIGAFVSALARGESPFAAARYANAAAAISVTRHGGSSAPTDAEINDFLAAMRPLEQTDQDRGRITA
jgi:sugar/nucleoside kinase (ribokinase family)